MSEAPKRVHIGFDNVTTPRVFGDGIFVRINADVPYVRADIADALAKAAEPFAHMKTAEHAALHAALAVYREAK